MYNSQNSTPRKGFGQRATHKCKDCGHKMTFTKVPFMVVCPTCNSVQSGSDLIEIKDEM